MVCQGWRCIISRQQDVLQKQKGKHKRLAWLFWVAFGIIILITLLLAALVFWIIWTQNFTTATSIVGLIASILGIMSGPPILLFTITKWPKRQFAPTFPVTPPEEPLPSQLPAEQPHTSEVWNIPYHRNPFFTGREQLLTVLHENLTASKAAILTQPQAISGLGGIGKTQTAVEYAYRYKQEYRSILWASAASRNTLLLDFVAIANVLELPEYQAQDQNISVAAVKRWLATHERWLLILANADELEVINDFLPTGASGHILITTRSQATGTMAHAIKVQEMDQQEGMLLLLRRAKVLASDAPLHQSPEEDQAKAGDIVTAMDGLPLA